MFPNTQLEYSPHVVGVTDVGIGATAHVRVEFANHAVVTANHAVVATNGMYLNPTLAGILRPCWSYFLALPHPRNPAKGNRCGDSVFVI